MGDAARNPKYQLPAPKSPLVVIVGETASGKSALALELAERFNGELVCADSWTVYKGFNIGTAKPKSDELSRVPHHLLDIVKPKEGFSAAIFKRLAVDVINDISERGKLPIMVGGTGLYIDSVLYDYSFLPAGSAKQRETLDNLSLSDVQTKVNVAGLDTTGIDVRNKRRLIRLLENGGKLPEKQDLRKDTFTMGLGIPRDHLEQLIGERVDTMMNNGLEAEVRQLLEQYGWDIEPMKGIGYREFQPYFEGKITAEQVKQQIVRDTLLLAKKQRTWFKRNKSIQWVEDKIQVVDLVTTFLNKYQ